MAPTWIFAIMFVLSAFLGMGQATIRRCGDDQESQCVEIDLCGDQNAVQMRMIQCPYNQVCCRVEEINNLDGYEIDEFH